MQTFSLKKSWTDLFYVKKSKYFIQYLIPSFQQHFFLSMQTIYFYNDVSSVYLFSLFFVTQLLLWDDHSWMRYNWKTFITSHIIIVSKCWKHSIAKFVKLPFFCKVHTSFISHHSLISAVTDCKVTQLTLVEEISRERTLFQKCTFIQYAFSQERKLSQLFFMRALIDPASLSSRDVVVNDNTYL